MTEIISQFESIPDLQAAEAFSEFYFRLPDFKVATIADDLDPDGMFPPVPAWYTAVGAAYLEDPDTKGYQTMRQQFTMVPMHGHTAEAIGTAYLAAYSSFVGPLHEIADTAAAELGPELFDTDVLAVRTIETAKLAKLRTVASFAMCSARDSNVHYSALVIPRRTYDQLPLEDREQWLRVMQQVESLTGLNVVKDAPPHVAEIFKRVLQNDIRHKHLAFFGAALNLPRVEIVERAIDESIARQSVDKYAGMSRAERRAAQAQERRQNRKPKH